VLLTVAFSLLVIASFPILSHSASAQTVTAPSAPQNLQAVTISSSQINLGWSDPSSNGGSPVTGYKIERSADNGNTWSTIISDTNYTEDGYLDHGLAPSSAYTYRVSAINSAGIGQSSNTASATTNSNTVPPPPTNTGVFFHDNYSSSTGWTQLGSEVTVDSPQFPGMVKYYNEQGGGGVDQERVYKQLPSVLPTYNWVLETTYEFSSSSIPSSYPVALTIDSGNPETTPYLTWAKAIVIQHGIGTDQLRVGFVNNASAGISISPNVPYYLRLERTQSQLELFVFSDPARTTQVAGSPVSLAADPTALQNIDYIQHSGSISSGPARTVTGQVTNTTIYIISNSSSTADPPAQDPPAPQVSSGSGIALTSAKAVSGTTSSNQITLPGFDAGSNSNGLLVVGITANNNNAVSVTFGGTALTQGASSFYNNDAEFWYLKNPSGKGDIVVTTSGPTQSVVGAYSFSGVDQSNPIPTSTSDHNTSPSSPHISITTKYQNDWVLDLPSIYGGVTLGSPTCAQQWNINMPGAITGASSTQVVSSPSSTSCSWTASNGDLWDDIAIELKAAG